MIQYSQKVRNSLICYRSLKNVNLQDSIILFNHFFDALTSMMSTKCMFIIWTKYNTNQINKTFLHRILILYCYVKILKLFKVINLIQVFFQIAILLFNALLYFNINGELLFEAFLKEQTFKMNTYCFALMIHVLLIMTA